MSAFKERLKEKVVRYAAHKHAEFWLAVVSFTEASFFLVPPEVLMVPMGVVKPDRMWRYVIVTVVTSVLGALFGYFVGAFFFETLGVFVAEKYGLFEQLIAVGDQFEEHAFGAIFIAAFTPIPYKVFTIGAGFFGVNLITLILASIVGRGVRYALIGYIFKVYGEAIGRVIFKYFNIITFLVVIGGIAFALFRFL